MWDSILRSAYALDSAVPMWDSAMARIASARTWTQLGLLAEFVDKIFGKLSRVIDSVAVSDVRLIDL
jgi:hypothetical protein